MKGIEIKKILQNNGYTLKEVAELMGETPQNLNSMLGAQDIKTGVVERIAIAIKKNLYFFYRDIPSLMTDKEIIEQDKEVEDGKWITSSKAYIDKESKPKNKSIPLIPVDAMAGYMKGEMQVLEHECERYVVPAFKEAEFLITVKGSSMYPKYNSGDIVACKKLPLTDLFFQWNKVYVLDTVQGALIKRVKKTADPDHILICSDNEKYEPFELHKSQINSIALVIGVIRLE